MAENYYNISSHIDDLIPEHINNDHPELVQFMKVYALYLEHRNKSGFYLNQLDHQRDIDLIEEELLDELQNEIGVAIPRSFSADPRIFYRRLVEFYKSRGTPESIHAFFNLIYNDEVEIYFPKVDMLIPSEGKWFNSNIKHLEDSLNTPVGTFVNRCDLPDGTSTFGSTVGECETSEGTFTSQYKVFYADNTWTLSQPTDEITRHMVDDLGYMPLFDDANIAIKRPSGNWELYNDHSETLDQVPNKCVLPDTSVTYGITEEACDALSGTFTARHMHTNLSFPEILPIGTIVKAFKKGVYTEVDGFLSDKKYIQDSYFYQKFSYVLRTGRNIEDWKSAFTRLVHPSGFIFFGQIYLYINALTDQTGLFKYEDTDVLEDSTYDLGVNQDGWYQPGYQIKLFRIDINLDSIYGLPGVHDNPFEFYNDTVEALQPIGTLIQADTYIEKSFVRPGSIGFDYLNDGSIELREVVYNDSLLVKTIGFKDHFENTKFFNPRPIGEFGTLTFEDAINKRIGNIQIGAEVTIATI